MGSEMCIRDSYEDGSKRVLNSSSLSDEALDVLYKEIDRYLDDESFNYNVEDSQ